MPFLSQYSQRPLSSSGVSMAPVGLDGEERMRPLTFFHRQRPRRRTTRCSSLAVTLNSSFTGTVTTLQPSAVRMLR